MSRARNLAIFTVVIAQGVVGIAVAQSDGAQPGPDLAPPEAKPASELPTVKVLTMEEADKLMEGMDATVTEIEKLLAATRAKGDALKILCVSDKLTKLKKVRVEATPMKAGVGNPETQLKASGDLHGANAKTVKLREDALVCVGEDAAGDEVVSEVGSVEKEGDGSESDGTDGPDTGGSFGALPPDPFVSLPPVVKSPTG